MANITNFRPGETLTAEALNQAFSLVGARADAVIGIAQEAKEDAAEALAEVDQATEHVPELIEKVEEIEEVIPNLATTASVTTAQAAAESYADTVGVNTAATAKAYTDSQVDTIDTQLETISSELTAQGAEIDEVTEALEDKADADSVYNKSETYTKSQVNGLYDVLPQLSSGTVIAQIKTPAGTKPLYAPQGGSGGSSVEVDPIVTSGTHIADITVDGVEHELYAPTSTGGGVTIEEVDAEIEEYLESYPTTADLTAALAVKADSSSVYSKTEVDTALSNKADASTTYSKTEVDTALADKADSESLQYYALAANVPTKTTFDNVVKAKNAPVFMAKECVYRITNTGETPYTFQFHDGVFVPENTRVSNSNARIGLAVMGRDAQQVVPITGYIDSEQNYDKLNLYVDSALVQSWSGQNTVISYNLALSGVAGTSHFVELQYVKDSSQDKGNDCCAIKIGTDVIASGGGGTETLPVHYYITDIPEVEEGVEYPTVYFTPSMMTPAANVSTGSHVLDVYAVTYTGVPVKYINAAWNGWSNRYEVQFPEYAAGGVAFITLRSVSANTGQKFFYNEGAHAREKYIALTGIPETASSDITATCAFTALTVNPYEVTVIFDDPTLKFKDIVYDDDAFTVTLPKECAGHSGYVHVKEVTS